MNVRQNLITGEPFLYAPDRAERQNAFITGERSESCPFCPGMEAETPPEIDRIGDTEWRARLFPNKYPASPHHEVLVESPDHNATFDQIEHSGDLMRLLASRYVAMMAVDGIRAVVIFKNQGSRAGASIAHLHSQIIALPFVPQRVEREAAAFARSAECSVCNAIRAAREQGLMIAENDRFAWFAPESSAMTCEQWIAPKRHHHDLSGLAGDELGELGETLRRTARANHNLADAYNWMFLDYPSEPAAHWYIDVIPRLTTIAGFELATGGSIGIVDPAVAAQKLREGLLDVATD